MSSESGDTRGEAAHHPEFSIQRLYEKGKVVMGPIYRKWENWTNLSNDGPVRAYILRRFRRPNHLALASQNVRWDAERNTRTRGIAIPENQSILEDEHSH